MNCRQARELFSSRLDNELDHGEGLLFEQHVAGCVACSEQWAAFARTVQLVRSLPQHAPDPSFVGQVLDRVRAYEAGATEAPAAPQRRRVPARLKVALEDLAEVSWARILFPARLAGAVALGAALGFVVSQKVWSPERSSGPIAQNATHRAESPVTVSTTRPFVDLVPTLTRPANRPVDGTGVPSNIQGMPGSSNSSDPGRQVMSRGPGGQPQVTF
jgi:hypothetical protein